MTRLAEGVYVRSTEDNFIEIQVVKYSYDIDVGETLNIEAEHAAQMLTIARRIHQNEGPYQVEDTAGQNSLTFILGGFEFAPILNIMNKRTVGSLRPGISGAALAWDQITDVLNRTEILLSNSASLDEPKT